MKLIFLDIDGVLNSPEHMRVLAVQGREDFFDMINDDMAARLKKACDETGAQIVVSSSWRHIKFVIQKLRNRFNLPARWKTGCYEGTVSDGKTVYSCRGVEILKFLEEFHHEVEKYVVIDDESYDIRDFIPESQFIHIADHNGIRDEHVKMIVEALK